MPRFELRGRSFDNPVELALDVIGGKWKMPILWRLDHDLYRYNDLKRSLGEISHKMLTQQLRELERDGLIHREAYAEVPPRVEYSITERGRTTLPAIGAIHDWGQLFLDAVEERDAGAGAAGA